MTELKPRRFRLTKFEKLNSWHKGSLYFVVTVLWITGAVHGLGRRADFLFDLSGVDALWSLLLKVHGGFSFIFTFLFGSLLFHISSGIVKKWNRKSGVSMLTTCVVLIVTGVLLYYTGDERTREITVYVHLIVGLLLPILICVHVA